MIEGKGERMYFTFNFLTTMYGVVNGYVVREKIEKVLYKLHVVSRKVTGLAPFCLNPHPLHCSGRREFYYAFGYTASFIVVYSYAIHSYLFTTNTGHLYISKIVTVMENGYMFSEFMVTSVAIIIGLVLRHRVPVIFEQLAGIDEQLKDLKKAFDHKRQHRLLTAFCVILLGSFVFLLIVTILTVPYRAETFDTPVLDVMALAISSFCFLLQIVQFTVMVLLVLSRYQAINESFSNLVGSMSLFGEDALVAFETFSVLLKYLGVNPPISCDRKRTRLSYRCINIVSIVLSTIIYGYLLFSISLDSSVLKAGLRSLIVTRMHDLYFVLRYITVIVVQVHVLNNGGEINRLLRALNSISNAVVLLAYRKGASSKLRFFGTVRFAKGLRVFSMCYPFVCLAITYTILKLLNWNQLIGYVFQFVRLLYFTTYVHLWLQATLAALLVLARYEALKNLFGNMRWFSVSNVYETVQPFMLLLGSVGLAPYGYRLAMKPINRYLELCYVLVYIGTYTYALYSFLFVANVTDFHLSLIIGIIECINLCCQYLTMVFAIVFAWAVKGRIISILCTLHECDTQLSQFSPSIDHKKMHLKVSMLAVGIVTSYILLLAVHLPMILELVPHIEPSLKEILPSSMFGLCFLLQICQFLLFLLVLHHRYCVINQTFGEMLTSDEDALKAFECFTLVVKCLGLYPPVTCSRKRTILGYKMCNLLAIAISASFYGFLLLFHSLDLETIKLGSGSLITSRMHDVYFVSRYLTVLAVLLHSYINQDSVDQLFGSLNEVSSGLVTLNTDDATKGSIGYFGTQRFARHLRWLSLVYPLMFVSMTCIVERWLPWFGVQVHAFNLVRLLYFYSYVHLWVQAILTLFLVLSRFIALNRLFSSTEAFQPFLLLLKFLGLTPFFSNASNKRLLSVLNVIILLLIGTLYINGPCRQIRRDMRRFQSSPLAVNSRIFTYLLGTMVYHLTMLINFLHRHRLCELFQAFVNIDRELQQVGVRINYRIQRFLITGGMVCFLSGIFVTSALVYAYKISVLNNQPNFEGRWYLNMFSFVYYNAAFPTITSYFAIVLWFLLVRFQRLAMAIRMYFPTSPTAVENRSEFAICNEKEQINVLKQIKILHDKLNDVVELVNYCFSVQGKRIGILVHKAINCSSSSTVINELNLFSQQLLHRSPVITCGLFVYDWTLWYTMIGATATYLIILIQFDVSFPNLVNVNATAVYHGSA
uniref:Gustatory receptor n=1 Tax=Anopheles christyi TaxID=43041 RepID=A0A182JQN3_9DIPT